MSGGILFMGEKEFFVDRTNPRTSDASRSRTSACGQEARVSV